MKKSLKEIRDVFPLNFDINFLNHGSFGSCPSPVFDAYQNWQRELEKEPIQFILYQGMDELKRSRQVLSDFIQCDPMDIVYVPNPTTAMNIVIRSLPLSAGDEILSTDQEYGAIDKVWDYYCERSGAVMKRQPISLPMVSKEIVLEQFWAGLTPKTKYVFLSEITSTTALIYPVKEICEKARSLGLTTIIDGAHVTGHIPFSIREMQADVYTGTCHKWLLSPKGSSYLYASPAMQKIIDPLVISWGYKSAKPSGSDFQDYFTFNGTRDFSAYLCTPEAIQFRTDYHWEEACRACRQLAKDSHKEICDTLESYPLSPLTDEFIGQIVSFPIKTKDPERLKDVLYKEYGIEIPVMVNRDQFYLRVSYMPYNNEKNIEHLINSLRDIKRKSNLLG